MGIYILNREQEPSLKLLAKGRTRREGPTLYEQHNIRFTIFVLNSVFQLVIIPPECRCCIHNKRCLACQRLMMSFILARRGYACIGYMKNSCQDRWHVQHAVIERHVVTNYILAHHRSGTRKWCFSPCSGARPLWNALFLQRHNRVCR